MTKHRQPSTPVEADESAGAGRDGALGAPRHRIAMTMLGSTVAACAVFGTVLSSGPIALAADTKPAAPAAPAKTPAQPTGLRPAAPAPIGAKHQIAVADLAAEAAAEAAAQAQAAAAAAKPAPTHTPAPVKVKAPTKKSAPAQSNPYAGESAYQVAEGIVPSGEFACFDWIVTRESGWNVEARNPSSGAYGLGQALPGDKMASAGPDWETNPATQIKWTLGYMDERYGSPCGAQSFWESHGWY